MSDKLQHLDDFMERLKTDVSDLIEDDENPILLNDFMALSKINNKIKKYSFIHLFMSSHKSHIGLYSKSPIRLLINVSKDFIDLLKNKSKHKVHIIGDDLYISSGYLFPLKQIQFKEAFPRGSFTDCIINGSRAHKIILSKRSGFFKIKFANWDSDDIILDFDDQVVELALDLVYKQQQSVLHKAELQQLVDLFQFVHIYFPDLVDVVANELTRFKDKDYLPELLDVYDNKHLRGYLEFDVVFED